MTHPGAFRVVIVASATVLVAFLVLPLVALFLRVPLGDLLSALTTSAARDALVVSLKTSAIAHIVVLAFGTPAAYLLATHEPRGKRFLVTLVEIPLVLPPAVAGVALLAAFGRRGLLGGSLETLGLSVSFTQVAVIVAVAFVASPFYVRTAIAAFSSVDRELLDASRTLGARPGRVFLRVAVPLARRGLAAGSALSWARGLGEFGATIMFAGSLQGITQTMPLAIYAQLDRNFDVAFALSAVLVVVSAGVILALRTVPLWRSPA